VVTATVMVMAMVLMIIMEVGTATVMVIVMVMATVAMYPHHQRHPPNHLSSSLLPPHLLRERLLKPLLYVLDIRLV